MNNNDTEISNLAGRLTAAAARDNFDRVEELLEVAKKRWYSQGYEACRKSNIAEYEGARLLLNSGSAIFVTADGLKGNRTFPGQSTPLFISFPINPQVGFEDPMANIGYALRQYKFVEYSDSGAPIYKEVVE